MGEKMMFMLLEELGYEFFQPDAIGINPQDDTFHVFESKHQARFKAPPFDGHGLPRWQVERRIQFGKRTGIDTILVVFDKETGETFWQYLPVLEAGKHFDTFGQKPRRIYPIESFKKIVPGNLSGARDFNSSPPAHSTPDRVGMRMAV